MQHTLIGRKRELQKILSTLRTTDVGNVVYFQGVGGIGKSRLLIKLLNVERTVRDSALVWEEEAKQVETAIDAWSRLPTLGLQDELYPVISPTGKLSNQLEQAINRGLDSFDHRETRLNLLNQTKSDSTHSVAQVVPLTTSGHLPVSDRVTPTIDDYVDMSDVTAYVLGMINRSFRRISNAIFRIICEISKVPFSYNITKTTYTSFTPTVISIVPDSVETGALIDFNIWQLHRTLCETQVGIIDNNLYTNPVCSTLYYCNFDSNWPECITYSVPTHRLIYEYASTSDDMHRCTITN